MVTSKRNQDEIKILLSISRGAESRKKILELLLISPKNCSQVSKEINLEWWTVQKHLQLLLSKGLIKEISVGRIRYYKIHEGMQEEVSNWLKTS